ncbi:sensor histidine kinase [Streptomyces sp. 2RAF24]|uniref:sensor histidine kinase n=1 Tax=Streptomyces sp. 2RAF24 TaxID=3232997 RepID=UPI003F94349C
MGRRRERREGARRDDREGPENPRRDGQLKEPRRAPRLPLRRSLLGRLLLVSSLVAACSVAATAWIAVQTTSGAIEKEQGRLLADDTRVLDTLTGYAATHRSWEGVGPLVGRLAAETDRRIVLTTPTGARLADSAGQGAAGGKAGEPAGLPQRASAVVDPLAADTDDRIDPRAVGPYALASGDREALRTAAKRRVACLADRGVDARYEVTASGRPVVTVLAAPEGRDPDACPNPLLDEPTASEAKALAALDARVTECLGPRGVSGIRVGPDFSWRYTAPAPTRRGDTTVSRCVAESRARQLRPYTAPPARLFLVSADSPEGAGGFVLSSASTARIAGAAALVLALTVGASVLAAAPLVRPLRALTVAAQRMRDGDDTARVPVRGDDEVGRLARAFNAMSAQRARLEDQRRAMVGDVAHELRTPLSNIRGWLEAAQDGVAEPDARFLASLHEEAMLLTHVVGDLQDLAAADAGELRLHPEPLEVGELLAQVAGAHRAAAEAAGVRITADPPGGAWLTGDPVRLRQVVGNLVSNAVRHTPAGGAVTLTYGPADGGGTLVEVADTGSGIAPEDLPRVFDRFWRADRSRSRRTGGSGLGLAIVRKLVEAHGGTVAARSAPGRGTVFTVRLPENAVATTAAG